MQSCRPQGLQKKAELIEMVEEGAINEAYLDEPLDG